MFFVYESISNISHQVCKSKSIHFQLTVSLYQRHEKRPSVCSKNKENKVVWLVKVLVVFMSTQRHVAHPMKLFTRIHYRQQNVSCQ